MNWSILPSRVAGDVAEHGVPRRPLVQPVDRHDREQLLDGPAVGHRLEQREVAEVGVREHGVERLRSSSGTYVQLLAPACWMLAADRPVEVLGQAALLERQVAAG